MGEGVSKNNKQADKPDPYAQAQDAAHTNQSQASCPYEYYTPEGEQWVMGFQDGGGTD
jgi:hypothetical protein